MKFVRCTVSGISQCLEQFKKPAHAGFFHSQGVDTLDRDGLVRLAGEQAPLTRDLHNLNVDQQHDLLALRNLVTNMVLHVGWHAKGTALLDRIR